VPTLLAVAGRIVEFEAGSGLGVADGSVRRLPAKIGRLPAVYQLIRRKIDRDDPNRVPTFFETSDESFGSSKPNVVSKSGLCAFQLRNSGFALDASRQAGLIV
jgi:hypothetical protein